MNAYVVTKEHPFELIGLGAHLEDALLLIEDNLSRLGYESMAVEIHGTKLLVEVKQLIGPEQRQVFNYVIEYEPVAGTA